MGDSATGEWGDWLRWLAQQPWIAASAVAEAGADLLGFGPEAREARQRKEEVDAGDRQRATMPATVDPETLYVLVERIGRGAFGIVYKGLARDSSKAIAVKVIDMEAARDEIDDLQKEIVMLSQCRSAHVVEYYRSYAKGMKLWIFMELMVGSAFDLMRPKKAPSFTEPEIACIARDMLHGLEYLHSDRRIHRDIKSANVLISETGMVKLADLGASTQLSAFYPKASAFCGTLHWMAPEIVRKEQYDMRVDIFSFGITLWELARRVPPHDEQPGQHASYINSIHPLPALPGDFSKDFKEIIAACVRLNPGERPSARDLLKYRWIKNARKPSNFLQEKFAYYDKWRLRGGDDDDDDDDDSDSDADADDRAHFIEEDPSHFWDFSPGSPTPEQRAAAKEKSADDSDTQLDRENWSAKFKPPSVRTFALFCVHVLTWDAEEAVEAERHQGAAPARARGGLRLSFRLAIWHGRVAAGSDWQSCRRKSA